MTETRQRPMSPFVFDNGETSEEEMAATETTETPEAPEAPEAEAAVPVSGDRQGLEGQVVSALRTVYDPEIPVNLYEMGLIYRIGISDGGKRVEIDMTLTAPGCPVAGILPGQVEHAVRGMVHGVEDVVVELVWDPPWNQEMLSEAARLELGLF